MLATVLMLALLLSRLVFKAVVGTMQDMLFYICFGDPVAQGFQTDRMTWMREYDLLSVAILRLTCESQKFIVEEYDNPADCTVDFGLALLELQHFV